MTIDFGTIAGQALVALAPFLAAILTYFASRLMSAIEARFKITISDSVKAEAANAIQHAINWGAAKAAADAASKGKVTIVKDSALAYAVQFIYAHHNDLMKAAYGINVGDKAGIERLMARFETAITDPAVPTPKVLDALPTAPKPANLAVS